MNWRTKAIMLKSTTSPKIYDRRTPQKKSGTIKTHSSDSSDMMFDPTNNYKPTEPTKPTNRVMDSKPTNTVS